jgi:predicted metalloprotease with PDZ domain
MSRPQPYRAALRGAALLALSLPVATAAAAQTATLELDARDAPRRVLHAHLVLPAKPGPLILLYPKWIPGEHGPTGPINSVVGLRFKALGRELGWRRDPVDAYTFHLEVPAGAEAVEADLDCLYPAEGGGLSASPSTTPHLASISWNNVVLYPQGPPTDQLLYQASLRLPDGWSFATALPVSPGGGELVRFEPVSLTTLIDSPVLAGEHFVKLPLDTAQDPAHKPTHEPAHEPAHEIDIAADSEAALEGAAEFAKSFARVPEEGLALFGAPHFRHYNWLLALSRHVDRFGLEHHESSDNRMSESALGHASRLRSLAFLFSHEYVHSWNGKYRRPAGLATPDYQQPIRGDLLWVYEGLTQYLAMLLPARGGLWTPEFYRERLAQLAARLDYTAGRKWRSLRDTGLAAPILQEAPGDWKSWRRGADFYDEPILVWLEVDTLLRQKSEGSRSLDDLCRRFLGGPGGLPTVRPYTEDDLVGALSELMPFDWRGFFRDRIDTITQLAPHEGIEASGWRLVYTETPNQALDDLDFQFGIETLSFSVGLEIDGEGGITDVTPGLPAHQAGLSPGMKLLAVNGRKWSSEAFDAALQAAKIAPEPIELLAEDGESTRAYWLDYHGGPRYPHLERDPGKPDLLSEILKPLAARR